LSLPDRWILSRLHGLIANVQRLFDTYQYGEAGRQIYEFLWSEFADWFIEISKETLYGADEAAKSRERHVLAYTLETALRLLHPYMPFLTEEVWQYLPHEGEALIIARWPEADASFRDEEAEAAMPVLIELISGIRNVRATYEVDPGRRLKALAHGGSHTELIATYAPLFERLARIEQIDSLAANDDAPDKAASVVVGDATLYLPLAGMVDIDAERQRLQAEMENLTAQLERSEKLLGNKGFVEKAKPEVVQRERDKLADLQTRQEAVKSRLVALAG
ncbi:MAG: class I tRNA ligase family protein, partial [Anaerolineae bacterium]|nr:class I tRNA ligase family protein [Anaerolineae bacterium]